MKADLVIFRCEPFREDPDSPLMEFVQADYVNGELSLTGTYFTVPPESSYHQMGTQHIVIAQKIPGGSHDLLRFEIMSDDGTTPAVVHQMSFDELSEIVDYLIEEHFKEAS